MIKMFTKEIDYNFRAIGVMGNWHHLTLVVLPDINDYFLMTPHNRHLPEVKVIIDKWPKYEFGTIIKTVIGDFEVVRENGSPQVKRLGVK